MPSGHAAGEVGVEGLDVSGDDGGHVAGDAGTLVL